MRIFFRHFSLILSLIGYTIYSLIIYGDLSIIINNFYFANINIKNKYIFSLKFIFIFILASIYDILVIFVIYYLSPTILTVSDIISPMLYWIVVIIQNKDDSRNIINIILYGLGYLIALLSSLIYNEIIICNFCGLNEYTKKGLEKKLEEELNSSNNETQIEISKNLNESINKNESEYNSSSEMINDKSN